MKNLQNLQLDDYIGILKRRFLWILVPGLLAGSVTAVYVHRLPNVYVSETVILVEPPKIPAEYVRPTTSGSIQSRLSTITQQIMSRTRLEKIITQNNLYVESRKRAPMEDVVAGMRYDIDLKVTKADAFTLSYEAYAPEVAQVVTSQLASLYIEESLKIREEQNEGVNDFLDSQLKETQAKLLDLETKVSDFRIRHMGALPEQQNANVAVLNGLQQQLQSSIDSVNRLEEQKSYQQRLLSEVKSFNSLEKSLLGVWTQPSTRVSAPVQNSHSELDKLKAQRGALLIRYTRDHPDVRKLDVEIARLERSSAPAAAVDPEVGKPGLEPATEPAVSQPDVESMQINSQVEVLGQQIKRGLEEQQKIREQIALYQSRVNSIPRVEQMQREISRDYEITKQHYQALLTKKNDAAMATNLEKRQKGEQFRIIDPASYPQRPSKPDRMKLNLLGFAAGLALGFGLAVLFELRDESIRSEHELASLTGLPILVSIPLIEAESSKSSDPAGTKRWRLRRLLPVGNGKAN